MGPVVENPGSVGVLIQQHWNQMLKMDDLVLWRFKAAWKNKLGAIDTAIKSKQYPKTVWHLTSV